MAREAAADSALDPMRAVFLTHSDRYMYGLGRTSYLLSLKRRLKLSNTEFEALAAALPDYSGPYARGMHRTARAWAPR